MILTPMRRYGAMILMLLTIAFSGEVLAKTHATQTSQKSHITEKVINRLAVNKSILAIVQRAVHFLICENTLPEPPEKKRFSGPLCLTSPAKMPRLPRTVIG